MKRKRGRVYVGDQYYECHSGYLWTVTDVQSKIRLYTTQARILYPGLWVTRDEFYTWTDKEILIEADDPL